MARFKFGKSKKKVDDSETSMTSSEQDHIEDRPNSMYQGYKESQPLPERPEVSLVPEEQEPLPEPVPEISQEPVLSEQMGQSVPTGLDVMSPWKRIKLYDSPFPRYRHTASAISSDKNEIFLMGGLKEGSVFGDTWKLAPKDDVFVAKNIEVANNNNPPARVGHSSVLCGNAYIIYGGDTVDTDFNGYPDNNFYLFNINNNKYTIPSHILNKPNGRYGHTIGVISLNSTLSRLYLFGGQLELEVFNDLYYFELNTFKSSKAKWELIDPMNNFKPPPIANHSMSIYKNKIYIFGGIYNNEKVSNDLWCFDALINKWSQLPTSGNIPPPVNEHSSCIINDQLFIYGGNDFHGLIYDALYVLNLHTLVWSKLSRDISNGPGPRCGHSMTFLPNFNQIIIMGGDKNDYFSNSDPQDLSTYEFYNGEELGTMLYALDLNTINQFLDLSLIASPNKKKIAASSAPKRPESPSASIQDLNKQSLQRHARSFSAGPEDFRTPTGSPGRGGFKEPRDVSFVDVDVPSSTNMSEKDLTNDTDLHSKNLLPPSADLNQISPGSAINSENSNGHASLLDNYNYADSTENLKDSTPIVENSPTIEPAPIEPIEPIEPAQPVEPVQKRGLLGALNGAQRDRSAEDAKVKKIISELTNELNELKSSTKIQMQNATEKINSLEMENNAYKQNDQSTQIRDLQNSLIEKETILQELKNSIDPSVLSVDNESESLPSSDSKGITELTKYKLDRMELNNKLIYLEQENLRLSDKFNKFEPFMNNQIGDLSNFQKIIKVQEEKIHNLSQQVKDEQILRKEINDWKYKFENLNLEFENYKSIHNDEEFSDDEQIIDESGNRSITSGATGTTTGKKSKKDISSHLENLVGLWSSNPANYTQPTEAEARNLENPNDNPVVLKLQQQVNEILRISKEQQEGSQSEVKLLQDELSQKLQALKTFEINYRDALQSVNNTSKALNLTQDELNSQRNMIEKLIKENNELKLFKKASRRISSRATPPSISEEKFSKSSSPIPEAVPEYNKSEEDDDEVDGITSAHFNMKIKDLEADLFILKQERDQLKEQVTSLQKQLYLAQNNS